ncbi:MAG: 5'-nucleotidase, lipoprotein e(P4) family, partial [Hyphomicrobiales bacterium]
MAKTERDGGQSTPATTQFIIVLCLLAVALLIALLYLQLAPQQALKQEAAEPEPRTHEMLNAVLWHKTSAEYEAVARQAYATAQEKLIRGLEDISWSAIPNANSASSTSPPAVILDLDETVLDNLPFEEHLITNDAEFSSKSFQVWCENETAEAIPGAVEFIRTARDLGVAVFFISAREPVMRDCTKKDLEKIGVPVASDDKLILTGGAEKETHREAIAKTHRVLMLIGDNLDDFTEGSRL